MRAPEIRSIQKILLSHLTLREGHRLRVSEDGALRGIFEPKNDEVTGGLRKQHNNELRNFSTNIIRIIK
jgi:hypothetical protein